MSIELLNGWDDVWHSILAREREQSSDNLVQPNDPKGTEGYPPNVPKQVMEALVHELQKVQ